MPAIPVSYGQMLMVILWSNFVVSPLISYMVKAINTITSLNKILWPYRYGDVSCRVLVRSIPLLPCPPVFLRYQLTTDSPICHIYDINGQRQVIVFFLQVFTLLRCGWQVPVYEHDGLSALVFEDLPIHNANLPTPTPISIPFWTANIILSKISVSLFYSVLA